MSLRTLIGDSGQERIADFVVVSPYFSCRVGRGGEIRIRAVAILNGQAVRLRQRGKAAIAVGELQRMPERISNRNKQAR